MSPEESNSTGNHRIVYPRSDSVNVKVPERNGKASSAHGTMIGLRFSIGPARVPNPGRQDVMLKRRTARRMACRSRSGDVVSGYRSYLRRLLYASTRIGGVTARTRFFKDEGC